MTNWAYYNEIDPKAAATLCELIKAGHIADGEVDTRSIEDVHPIELRGFTQCHFFAGFGVWSYALRLAGWPDERSVWTASCPCQPFSAAGKRIGFADERHLWSHLDHLIGERRPDVVFGEQVASKDGLAWFDVVQADMEAKAYAGGAVDLCAAGVGAPHIRQRLYWAMRRLGAAGVAHEASSARLEGWKRVPERADQCAARSSSVACGMAHPDGGHPGTERQQRGGEHGLLAQSDGADELGHADSLDESALRQVSGRAFSGATRGAWSDAEWIYCRDGKWRPVEPGTFPLAHGSPERVGRLRGYGNAIVAEAARVFIEAYLESEIA